MTPFKREIGRRAYARRLRVRARDVWWPAQRGRLWSSSTARRMAWCHTRSSQAFHAASSKAKKEWWVCGSSRMRCRSSSRTTRPLGQRTRPGTGSSTEHRWSQLPPPLFCRRSGFGRSGSASTPRSSWTANWSLRSRVIRHMRKKAWNACSVPGHSPPGCQLGESQPCSSGFAPLGCGVPPPSRSLVYAPPAPDEYGRSLGTRSWTPRQRLRPPLPTRLGWGVASSTARRWFGAMHRVPREQPTRVRKGARNA